MTDMEKITLTTAIIGAGTGITGVILGIINTCIQMNRNRIRLKVIPKIAYMVSNTDIITVEKPTQDYEQRYGNLPQRLCIEIINLSAFPVTISEAGFGKRGKLRHSIFKPEVSTGKQWPTRLESRESVTVYANMGERLDPRIMRKPIAFAKTDCDTVVYGTSPIFKRYIRGLNRAFSEKAENQ